MPVSRLVFGLTVQGRHHIPSGSVVIAANHLSHVDPPFVGAAVLRPIRFMAAADLQGLNRPLDFFLGFYGTIPLSRTGVPLRAMRTALLHLDRGGAVGVFPEGRRTVRWGADPPYQGAAWLALRAQVPLLPVAVAGTDQVMALEDRKIRPARVSVTILPPLAPRGTRAELTALWADAIDGVLR